MDWQRLSGWEEGGSIFFLSLLSFSGTEPPKGAETTAARMRLSSPHRFPDLRRCRNPHPKEDMMTGNSGSQAGNGSGGSSGRSSSSSSKEFAEERGHTHIHLFHCPSRRARRGGGGTNCAGCAAPPGGSSRDEFPKRKLWIWIACVSPELCPPRRLKEAAAAQRAFSQRQDTTNKEREKKRRHR